MYDMGYTLSGDWLKFDVSNSSSGPWLKSNSGNNLSGSVTQVWLELSLSGNRLESNLSDSLILQSETEAASLQDGSSLPTKQLPENKNHSAITRYPENSVFLYSFQQIYVMLLSQFKKMK